MADSTVKVTFIGDAKDLNRAIDDVDSKTSGMTSKFGGAKAAGLALGGAAIAGGAALLSMANSAAEDEKAAKALEKTLQNVTGATDDQVKGLEDWITAQGKAFGVADDDLRPALDSLVRGTKDVTKAQQLAGLAMDISAGTGKDLTSVSDALSKAYNGQLGPLKKLDPALADLVKSGASFEEVQAKLNETFGGQAQAAAETTAGKLAIAKVQFAEMQEEIGAKVIPILASLATWLVEDVIPAIEKTSKWIEENVIPVLKDMAGWINDNVIPALQAFGVWLRDDLFPALADLARWINENIIPALQAVAAFIRDEVIPVLAAVAAFIRDEVIPRLSDFAAFIAGVIDKWVELQVKVAEVVASVIGFLADLGQAVADVIGDVWDRFVKIWDGIRDIVQAAVDFVVEQIERITKPLDNALDKVGDLARKVGLVGEGNALSDGQGGYGIRGERAGGGPVSRGTWLVGENGPELLHMGGSGYVTPNNRIGGGVIVNVSTLDSRGVPEAVVEGLRQAKRMGLTQVTV